MKYLNKNGNGKGYKKRIRDAAEKLHREADKLRSKGEYFLFIPWLSILLDYMKDDEPEGDLERKLYIEKRSNMWKDDINDVFCELGYPEWLFVIPTKGVRLIVDAFAARKLQLQALKKECSIIDRKSKLLKQFSSCFTGQLKKELERNADRGLNTLKFIAGEIALDPKLPKKQKVELLGMIENYMSEDEDEEDEVNREKRKALDLTIRKKD